MAKSQEELQAFVDEIKAVCAKHKLMLVGTCVPMAHLGEITILEEGRQLNEYSNWDKQMYGSKGEDIQRAAEECVNELETDHEDGDDILYPFPFVYGFKADQ